MSRRETAAATRVEIAIAIVEHEGQFLIGRRGAHVALAGFWEFPGGKIESGETPRAAAIRECLEETGLEIRITGEYPAVTHDYDHAKVRLHFLAAAPLDPRASVPSRFCWVPAGELSEYEFPPANRGVLELLAGSKTA
jgi:8-oxo-dGTP diphosphatase